MSVSLDALRRKYAGGDDPWNFRTSPYEQAKFAATRAALSRERYRAGLELGCGNGALAWHLAPHCAEYLGLDAVETAVDSARRTVPAARFEQGWLPDDLPEGPFDLIVLSEILYFLDPADLRRLAGGIARRWSDAELICVTWLGETEHPLQGAEALAIFDAALPPAMRLSQVVRRDAYRIDRRVAARAPGRRP